MKKILDFILTNKYNPDNRISWNDVFKHPLFSKNLESLKPAFEAKINEVKARFKANQNYTPQHEDLRGINLYLNQEEETIYQVFNS